MDISLLVLYTLASFWVIATPGPTMLLALNNGTTKQLSVIVPGILGGAIPDMMLVSAVAFGLGMILSTSNILFLIIQYLGVAYLLWLAIQLWRTAPAIEPLSGHIQPMTPKTAFFRSFFVALFNPKAIVFFTAFLPQFIRTDQPPLPQYATLVSINVILNLVMMTGYALMGFYASHLLSMHSIKRINQCCAIILAGLAVLLAAYQRTTS